MIERSIMFLLGQDFPECCLLIVTGVVLLSHLSWISDDESDLWDPPLLHVVPHHAHHVPGECLSSPLKLSTAL